MSLDRVKFQSVDSPLTDANDYTLFRLASVLIGVQSQFIGFFTQIFTEQNLI